jgi:outer membrane protein, heavy metal efflux system
LTRRHITRALRGIILAAMLASAGCATYSPSPFEAGKHLQTWQVRSVQSEALRAFAERLATPAGREVFDPSDGLSLDEAEVVALFFNPALRQARADARVARAGLEDAGRWEDPSLGIDAERVLEDVDDRWVIGGTFNVIIPISGRKAVRRDERLAEADAASLSVIVRERQTLADIRRTWIEWSAGRERVAALRESGTQLDRLRETAAALAQAGELSPLDARVIRVEGVQRAAELLSAEAEERDLAQNLRAQMGLRPSADLKLIPTIAVRVPQETASQAHPQFLQAQAELQAAERAYELEIRKQIPDVSVGLGYGVDQGDSRLLFNGLIPLPVWNANREAIAKSRAKRDAAHVAAGVTLEALEAELAAAKLSRESAEARHRLIVNELLPLAEQQSSDAERLGAAGEANTLLVLDAAQRQLSARLAVIDASRDRALAAVRLAAFDSDHLTPHPTTTAPTEKEKRP